MTFGIILPIVAGSIGSPESNNPCYAEHESFPNGHVYRALVYKAVSGTYNIFLLSSYDWGQTWEEEQVSFNTGGNTTGHQYVGSVHTDLAGTGTHVVWYGLGYHQHPHRTYYPSQDHMFSILYKYRDSSGIWGIGNCTPYTHDATVAVVEYGGDMIYGDWHGDFVKQASCMVPCIDIDSNGDVHCAFEHYGSWNSISRHRWYDAWYKKLIVSTGVWGDTAWFDYTGGTVSEMRRPNIQVDTYDNPHISMTIKDPINTWHYDAHTTCWLANNGGGAIDSWPYLSRTGTRLWGQFPVANVMAELLYDTPYGSAGTPSYYHRMALSNFYTEGTFDYPHCIYSVFAAPNTGTWYKYMDATGWHSERISTYTSNYPSIAIGVDGMIYALALKGSGSGIYEYSKKALPTDAWSSPEEIASISAPRQVHHRLPVHYPWDGQDCSPFMASQSGWAKLFRCGFPASGGYGYFM